MVLWTYHLHSMPLHDFVCSIGAVPHRGEGGAAGTKGGAFPERSEVGLFSFGRQAGFMVF